MRKNQQNNWFITNLGEIASFIRGVTFPKGSRLERYETGTIAVATTKAAQQQGIEHDKLYFIPKSFVKHSEQFLLPNDIVISIANSLDLVGRVTFATKKDEDITWGAFLGVIRANPELIYPYFLYSFLITAETKQYFRKNARTTTNISNISSDSILSLRIPVPPLAEQKRIVKKIEELFGVIDEQVKKLEATQEALISYRQSVLQHYLSSDRRPEHTFGEVILKIIGGSTPSKSHVEYYQGNIPFMTVKDMTSEYLQDTAWHITQEAVKNSSTNIVPPNTLIIATRVGLGKIVQMSKAVAINQDLKGLILKKDVVDQTFFKYILKYKTSEILRRSRGTTVKGITLEDFKTIPFSLPTLPKQKAIVKKIETAFAFADKAQEAISASLEQAKQLKQSILKLAFEGKLVPQDPKDKPVDLSKIKKDK